MPPKERNASTSVGLSNSTLAKLDEIIKEEMISSGEKNSRSELIRRAVSDFIKKKRK